MKMARITLNITPVRMNNSAEYIPKIVVYVNCRERYILEQVIV